MQSTKKNKTFYTCACIVRLQVLICYVNTSLQRIIDRFFLKSPGLSVVSDAQCIESHARTSDNLRTWVFNSLNVQ